jgi:hypothetical protein
LGARGVKVRRGLSEVRNFKMLKFEGVFVTSMGEGGFLYSKFNPREPCGAGGFTD